MGRELLCETPCWPFRQRLSIPVSTRPKNTKTNREEHNDALSHIATYQRFRHSYRLHADAITACRFPPSDDGGYRAMLRVWNFGNSKLANRDTDLQSKPTQPISNSEAPDPFAHKPSRSMTPITTGRWTRCLVHYTDNSPATFQVASYNWTLISLVGKLLVPPSPSVNETRTVRASVDGVAEVLRNVILRRIKPRVWHFGNSKLAKSENDSQSKPTQPIPKFRSA